MSVEVLLSTASATGTERAEDFWSKRVLLKIKKKKIRALFGKNIVYSKSAVHCGGGSVAVGVGDRWQMTGDM